MDAAPPVAKLAAEGLTFEVTDRAAAGSGKRDVRPRLRLVDDVAFAVRPGRVFTVLGPSGSGKSTLLRCLNRLVEPTAGRVLLDGEPAEALPVQALRRRVGMVFQAAALFDGSVLDNVLYGPRARAGEAGERARDRDEAHELESALGLLRRVGLPDDFLRRPADRLSGGEAQRVSLARALANDPEVLLLDEPTAALDPTASQTIEELVLRLAAETDLTFVYVTHDVGQAKRIGDEGLLLVGGRVADAGSLPAFLDDPGADLTRRFVEGRLLPGAALPAPPARQELP
jgi:putative ABC transport system ATP-binding protein